jgi:thiamine biosynthesis lipoprotein
LPAGGWATHHIVDPRTCQPVPPVWRTVSVVAGTCVEANTVTTAAAVRGTAALAWLRELGVPARLVAADRRVITVGAWPADGARSAEGGTSDSEFTGTTQTPHRV